MAPPRRPNGTRRLPYWIGYAVVTLLLAAITGLFALVVLPQRFVLQAGLRESGISFPARAPGFPPAPRGRVVEPPPRRPPPLVPVEGPAQRLWREVLPLLQQERWNEALPLLRRHLEAHPGDEDVRREYARALVRAGRLDDAEREAARLGRANDRLAVRLDLARAVRNRGETERALRIYRGLVADHPDSRSLRLELARTLAWAERYDEAGALLAELLREGPDDPALRLELARVLFWADRLEEAREVLAGIPPDSREAAEADALDRRLAALLAPPAAPEEKVDRSLAGQARRAAARGDLAEAARLYRAAVAAEPINAELWREWIDFLQLRLDDLEAARDALAEYGERFGLTADDSYRLAQLEAWTGRTQEARGRLEELLREDPGRAEAWALLGDMRRWDGDRPGAAAAYGEALARDPGSETAARGLEDVRRQSETAARGADPSGAGPVARGFLDSDDFRRFDLAGVTLFRWGLTGVRVEGGFRSLRGRDLAGGLRTEEGAFGEVEVSHWWREATIRTALSAGLEHLDAFGVEPSFGVTLEIPPLRGFGLAARYRHGPAYPLTRTLESVLEPVRADQVAISLFHALGVDWNLQVGGELARLTQPAEDNTRLVGSIFVGRRLSDAWRVGLGSRFLSFDRPAAVSGIRRLYWDPSAFWATDLTVALRTPGGEGWGAHAAVSPGLAVLDERDVAGTEVVPQLRGEAGVFFLGERTTLSAELFYGRGRERDYSSFGFELRLQVRP